MATSNSTKPADDKEIDDLLSKASVWLGKAMKELNCDAPINVMSTSCQRFNTENVVSLFSEGHQFVWFQNDRLRQTRSELNATKSELVKSQKLVIVQQHEIIVSKDKMLASVQSAMTETVSETVKAGIKSYSDVVKCSSESTAQISSDTVRSAVKSVVQEEDRCKNLMLFGVSDEEKEDLPCKVQEVFSELGMKPATEVCRVGKTGNQARPRPVKLVFSCASTARHVLVQARKLRISEKFSSVFIRPDRTVEERSAHKLLIEELKKKREDDPGKNTSSKVGRL